MTNVPGPAHPLKFCGSTVEQVMFWVPQSGDIGMGVSILSYNGRVQFGLVTDRHFVTDPENIVSRFQPEFEKLVYALLLEPWEELRTPEEIQLGLEAELPSAAPAKQRRKPRPPRKKAPAPAADEAVATTPPRAD